MIEKVSRQTNGAPRVVIACGVFLLINELFYIIYFLYSGFNYDANGHHNYFHIDELMVLPMTIIIIGLCGAIFVIAVGVHRLRKEKALSRAIYDLVGQTGGVTPQDFLGHKAAFLKDGDFTGVYVVHNVTKDLYYVGQSLRVVSRLSQHFSGHGNGDVYADFKYGDAFLINVIPLSGSGYNSLDALERDAIAAYHAFDCGYNRTRGNSN